MIRRTNLPRVEWSPYFNATTSTYNFGPVDQLSPGGPTGGNIGTRTVVALVYPEGSGESTSSIICAAQPTGGGNDGPRFSIEHNSNSPHLQYRQSSNGTNASPARNAAGGTITYNAENFVAATYPGTLTGTDIRLYVGINGATVSENSYGGAVNGTGVPRTGLGNNFHVGNREDTDRTFNGSIHYFAQWNRVLDLRELIRIQQQGPLAVHGCVFCFANGRDYGPYGIRPRVITDVGVRRKPLVYAPLGPLPYDVIPMDAPAAGTFNASWNVAANTVLYPGARAA